MAKVIALCGKVCAGKSSYARSLRDRLPAVILNTDDITMMMPEEHDTLYPLVRDYMFAKAVEIVRAGANVVLDFGFWSRADRAFIRRFFADNGVEMVFHYRPISDEDWDRSIADRNERVRRGEVKSFIVDKYLKDKCLRLFEEPSPEEMDRIL